MRRHFAASLLALAVSPGLAADGAIDLASCRITAGPGFPGIDARCGTLRRPLDPASPDGDSIELSIAVVPALSLEPAADPFVPVAGGPGQSTIDFYAAWFGAFERVRQNRDILLVDQRGTGDSARLSCDIDDDIVEGKYSTEQTRRVTRECLDKLPYDPRFFTTSVAVADLEAVRAGLGYGPLNVYGISYGTRVAQHYARRYPQSTRTVILDGVVPPQLPLGPDIAIESQRAIDSVFDRCEAEADCNARFPTVRQDFALLLERLADGAIEIEMPNPVTGTLETVDFGTEQFAAAVRLLLYNPRTIALLPLLIDAAAGGNYAPLAAQFRLVATTVAESLAIGMHNAVVCTEDEPFIDWAAVDEAAIEKSYLGPLQLEAIHSMCSVWPAGILDADLREPLASAAPVLLLSGEADPITPPTYANLAAVDLERAWLVTGRKQGHGLAAVGCMPRVIGKFIDEAGLEEGGASCIDEAFAMPFFVDFTGPMP
jgi:pimeloyl-ACP methyl ester carboxylesterase